jgi:hypothetical protein
MRLWLLLVLVAGAAFAQVPVFLKHMVDEAADQQVALTASSSWLPTARSVAPLTVVTGTKKKKHPQIQQICTFARRMRFFGWFEFNFAFAPVSLGLKISTFFTLFQTQLVNLISVSFN